MQSEELLNIRGFRFGLLIAEIAEKRHGNHLGLRGGLCRNGQTRWAIFHLAFPYYLLRGAPKPDRAPLEPLAREEVVKPSPSLQSLVDERRAGSRREKRLSQALHWAEASRLSLGGIKRRI